MHKRDSVAWLAVTLTAAHLTQQANNIVSANVRNDEEFSLVVSFAIKYWGVEIPRLADAFGLSVSSIHGWAANRNLPQVFARKNVLDWIADDLRRRAGEIQTIIEDPVKIKSA